MEALVSRLAGPAFLGEESLTDGSFRGCVSGEQVVHMREKIGKNSKGDYNWDAIDGWEELE